jgi:hypothetical protein
MNRKHNRLKADLHLHTCEGFKEPFINHSALELIDAAMEAGYEVLSITNHDTVTYNNYLKDYARERGILLIPGIELTLKRKHVLIYNVKETLLNFINDLDDIKETRDRNNLVIAPHPFFPASCALGRQFVKKHSLFDAVELSHYYTSYINFNRKAVDMAEKFNLPMLGTSDCHALCQLNTTYSYIYAEKDTEAVFNAIKKGAVNIVTNPLSVLEAGMIFQELFLRGSVNKIRTAGLYLLSFLGQG